MTIQKALDWLLNVPVNAPKSTVLLRWMAGGVFLWEGLMKLTYPSLGVIRFTKLGFPAPGFTAGFVAWVEILGGLAFIAGWLTRPVAIAFVIEMIVAMLSTKIAVFLGTSPLGKPASPPQLGLGAVLHDIRSDYAQFMTSLFLLIAGPGPLSLDAKSRSRSHVGASSLGRVAVIMALLFMPLTSLHSMESPTEAPDAKAALAQKDYATATRLLKAQLAQHPNDPDILNDLGFAERQQGHLTDAFRYYDQALKQKPDFAEAHEYLGEAHLQAALAELKTLKGYGPKGVDEAAELRKSLQSALASL